MLLCRPNKSSVSTFWWLNSSFHKISTQDNGSKLQLSLQWTQTTKNPVHYLLKAESFYKSSLGYHSWLRRLQETLNSKLSACTGLNGSHLFLTNPNILSTINSTKIHSFLKSIVTVRETTRLTKENSFLISIMLINKNLVVVLRSTFLQNL